MSHLPLLHYFPHLAQETALSCIRPMVRWEENKPEKAYPSTVRADVMKKNAEASDSLKQIPLPEDS